MYNMIPTCTLPSSIGNNIKTTANNSLDTADSFDIKDNPF